MLDPIAATFRISDILDNLDKDKYELKQTAQRDIAQAVLLLESIDSENPIVKNWVAVCFAQLSQFAQKYKLLNQSTQPPDRG